MKRDDASPRWSLTVAGSPSPGVTVRTIKIWVASSVGGKSSVLAAEGLDLIPTGLEWSEDGKSLYFESGVKGEFQLFRVDLAKKSVEQTSTGSRAVRNADFNGRTNTRVYMVNDFKHLDDLYSSNLTGAGERKLTNFNETLWKQVQFAEVERFSYKSADDWDIGGFFIKPVGWQAGKYQ